MFNIDGPKDDLKINKTNKLMTNLSEIDEESHDESESFRSYNIFNETKDGVSKEGS